MPLLVPCNMRDKSTSGNTFIKKKLRKRQLGKRSSAGIQTCVDSSYTIYQFQRGRYTFKVKPVWDLLFQEPI